MVDFDWDSLTFSFTATDTMYRNVVRSGEEWGEGELIPFANIEISPAAGVLNYGQGIFEGMKAQRADDGNIVLFRSDKNAARFAEGAKRLGMPPANHRWVPPTGRGALYIRPVLWGSGAILGVAPAPEFTFMVYVCPVGPYFKGGMTPINLKVSDEYHRAAPGGSGGVKAIGNYAPGMMPSKMAKVEGYAEIIYLDAVEHRYIEEVGAANFFCVKDNVVYTPDLTGTILPGITRASVIQIARDLGHDVREERIDVDMALAADEAFCAGTAAVISPIGSIEHGHKIAHYSNGEVGPVTRKLYDALVDIQLKRAPDRHEWIRTIEL